MNSTTVKIIIAVVIIGLLNGLFFGLLDVAQINTSQWVSFGFVWVAFIFLLLTPLFQSKTSGLAVLSATMWYRSTLYFLVALAVGVFFIVSAPEDVTWPVIIQSLICAIFIILQLMGLLANRATEESIAEQRQESKNLGMLIENLRGVYRDMPDGDDKKTVEQVIKQLVSTPIHSHPGAALEEAEMGGAIENLCTSISLNDNPEALKESCRAAITAIRRRNTAVKLSR